MAEDVVFWKWISSNVLALATETSVYHWSTEGDQHPEKIFDRHISLKRRHIMNYHIDSTQKWLLLVGITAVDVVKPSVSGTMQLYSVEQEISRTIEGHAASFAMFKMDTNSEPSNLLCYAVRSQARGQLKVIELGKNAPFVRKDTELYFHSEAPNDFPVAMQVSAKYGLIYLITKCGFLHIFDVETTTRIFFLIGFRLLILKTIPIRNSSIGRLNKRDINVQE